MRCRSRIHEKPRDEVEKAVDELVETIEEIAADLEDEAHYEHLLQALERRYSCAD